MAPFDTPVGIEKKCCWMNTCPQLYRLKSKQSCRKRNSERSRSCNCMGKRSFLSQESKTMLQKVTAPGQVRMSGVQGEYDRGSSCLYEAVNNSAGLHQIKCGSQTLLRRKGSAVPISTPRCARTLWVFASKSHVSVTLR